MANLKDSEAARADKARFESPFLNPLQAAHYLGLAERTLRQYRSKKIGPAYRRHGKNVRYHIDDLLAWSQRPRRAGDDV